MGEDIFQWKCGIVAQKQRTCSQIWNETIYYLLQEWYNLETFRYCIILPRRYVDLLHRRNLARTNQTSLWSLPSTAYKLPCLFAYKTHFCRQKSVLTFVDKTLFFETRYDFVQPNWLLLNKTEFRRTKLNFAAQNWILLNKTEFCQQNCIYVPHGQDNAIYIILNFTVELLFWRCKIAYQTQNSLPWEQGSLGQHGAHLSPVGPRWAPGGPHVGPMNLAIWVNMDFYNHPTRTEIHYLWEHCCARKSHRDLQMYTAFQSPLHDYSLVQVKVIWFK